MYTFGFLGKPSQRTVQLVRGTLAAVSLVMGCYGIAFGQGTLAAATPGFTVHPPGQWKVFRTPATHGYTVFVVAEGRRVSVEAISRRRGVVNYTTTGERVGTFIVARFGGLGLYKMRFHASGPITRSTEPQGDCRGRRAEVRQGVFQGIFRWRGEEGFSRAFTREGSGVWVRSHREVCKGESAAVGPDQSAPPFLHVASRWSGNSREVEAYGSPDTGGILLARVTEHNPEVYIQRSIGVRLGESTVYPTEFSDTAVSGAWPFRGVGELSSDTEDAEPWHGSLEVDFPGRRSVSLVGSSFRVVPSHGSVTVHPLESRLP